MLIYITDLNIFDIKTFLPKMDNSSLEDFRTQWKDELLSKNKTDIKQNEKEASNCMENSVAQSSSSSNKQSFSLRENKSGQRDLSEVDVDFNKEIPRKLDTLEESHRIISTCYNKPESCYYSFSIVGKLLNFADREEHKNEIENTQINTGKRKNFEKDRKSYKRFKGANLKNIFTDKIQTDESEQEEKLLDRLIADIDEITEIPFFDISLPREVAIKIFQHLSISDLCSCAQVSKSWQSLANDELLWCWICHKFGQEMVYTTREKTNWKQIVRHNVERQRLLVTNWKSRTGKLTQLEYVKGNILCAVTSYADMVVSGYVSGEVKLWDLNSGDSCVFQPSSTALIVTEDSTESNMVQSLVTTGKITAASYTQGNIDIWSLDSGTQPIQTYTPPVRGQQSMAPTVCLSKGGNSVVVCCNRALDILYFDQQSSSFVQSAQIDNSSKIENVKYLESDHEKPSVIYADRNIVRLYKPSSGSSTDIEECITELHNLIDAPISVIDCKTEETTLAVAHSSFMDITDGCRIKLYDIQTGRLKQMLEGRAFRATCMNMQESPDNELVIGTADRKVHVFDTRVCEPVQTYNRHAGGLVCVQMDEWKVVSGAWDGFVCVWDRRMNTLLWDMHNRHPVAYSHFHDKHLVVGNVPSSKSPETDEFESTSHRRYRGSVYCYNFLEDLSTQDVPEICLSTYDQPDASRYNISLAVPYDVLTF